MGQPALVARVSYWLSTALTYACARELYMLQPVTERGPELNAAADMMAYSASVHPGCAIFTPFQKRMHVLTPSWMLGAALYADDAQRSDVASIVRFGCPSARS